MTTIEASNRDHRAWSRIFEDIDRLTGELDSLRCRIRAELGFERVKVSDLKPGDRVRSHLGDWYTVGFVYHAACEDPPRYRIHFADGEGFMDVEAQWDGHPWPAMVTRAHEVCEEPF